MKHKLLPIVIVSVIIIGLFFIIRHSDKENNLISPISSKLQLINFQGECGAPDFGPSRSKIIEKDLVSNVLKVKVLTAATCCVNFEGEIEYFDNVINLKFIETGMACDCICTAILYYEIEGAISDNYNFKLNGKKLN